MADVDADAIYEARYDVTSAAHHLRMPRSTLSAWTQGQDGFRRVLDLPQPGFLSFVNLTEAFVLLAMRRRYSITLPRIRQAVSYVEAEMGVQHPLAFQQFRTDFVDLFVTTALGALNVSQRGQTRMDSVLQDLDRIEWRAERPIALFPIAPHRGASELRPIRISPLVAFGRPVLTGTRIPTIVVFERFSAGESVRDLAEDFDVPEHTIEEAVRAESAQTAA
jgi:uncharacterized protein (DUF433 family)